MTRLQTTSRSALLFRAAERAMRAPSIHNTQPWRFVLAGDVLDVYADHERQLDVIDPRGRQLMISCGCAVYNARVVIAAAGFEPIVRRLPDAGRPDLVARIGIGGPRYWPGSDALYHAIDERSTSRGEFTEDPIPDWLVVDLTLAARAEGAVLVPITQPAQRNVVIDLSRRADQIELSDPDYVAELASWTTEDPDRSDGVEVGREPPVAVASANATPLRDFRARASAPPAVYRDAAPDATLLLLASHDDEPRGWLTAGEALEHVWLKLTDQGFRVSPLTQVVEVRETHDRLQAELGLTPVPQVLLRVGRGRGSSATRRRPIAEVIDNGR